MSGYVGLVLLLATPVLAMWSDWVVNNSSQHERNLVGLGFAMVTIAVVIRIECVRSLSLNPILRFPTRSDILRGPSEFRSTTKLGIGR